MFGPRVNHTATRDVEGLPPNPRSRRRMATVQTSFGGGIADVDALRRASQHLQADGLRYAVEANRRREPRHSGSLPWQFNESYPNAWCTAAVDHRGDPKPAYFAVRRAYEPVHVSARFEGWATDGGTIDVEVWAWSGLEDISGAEVRAVVRGLDGGPIGPALSIRLDLVSGSPVSVGRVGAPCPTGLAILDLALLDNGGGVASANRYVLSGTADLGPLRHVPPAHIEVDRMPDPEQRLGRATGHSSRGRSGRAWTDRRGRAPDHRGRLARSRGRLVRDAARRDPHRRAPLGGCSTGGPGDPGPRLERRSRPALKTATYEDLSSGSGGRGRSRSVGEPRFAGLDPSAIDRRRHPTRWAGSTPPRHCTRCTAPPPSSGQAPIRSHATAPRQPLRDSMPQTDSGLI